MIAQQPDMATPDFSQKEMTRLWNRMRSARERGPPAARKEWAEAEAMPMRAGKTTQKKLLLHSWLRDPTWSRLQVSESSKREVREEEKARSQWLSRGRLEVLCGPMETRQLIENAELEWRPHPTRPANQPARASQTLVYNYYANIRFEDEYTIIIQLVYHYYTKFPSYYFIITV